MAVSSLESAAQRSDADRAVGNSPFALWDWLRAFVSACLIHGGRRLELDDLSEEQLEDIGVTRAARRERWLDGCESPLTMGFEYRQHSGSE